MRYIREGTDPTTVSDKQLSLIEKQIGNLLSGITQQNNSQH